MPKAYDYDLRRQVIEAIELNGMKRCEASELFGISRNTIHQWFQLKAETGDVKAKPTAHRVHSHKITDWETFRAFVAAHPDKTQAEMAELWQDDISARLIVRSLQQIGFTRKKRPMATESEMSKSDQTSASNQRHGTWSRLSMPMKQGWIAEMIMPMATAQKGSDCMP